jgi:hypothetical protein
MPILPVNNGFGNLPPELRIAAIQRLKQRGVKQPKLMQILAEVRKHLEANPLPDPYAGMTEEERFDAEFRDGKYDACPDEPPKGFRSWL